MGFEVLHCPGSPMKRWKFLVKMLLKLYQKSRVLAQRDFVLKADWNMEGFAHCCQHYFLTAAINGHVHPSSKNSSLFHTSVLEASCAGRVGVDGAILVSANKHFWWHRYILHRKKECKKVLLVTLDTSVIN